MLSCTSTPKPCTGPWFRASQRTSSMLRGFKTCTGSCFRASERTSSMLRSHRIRKHSKKLDFEGTGRSTSKALADEVTLEITGRRNWTKKLFEATCFDAACIVSTLPWMYIHGSTLVYIYGAYPGAHPQKTIYYIYTAHTPAHAFIIRRKVHNPHNVFLYS